MTEPLPAPRKSGLRRGGHLMRGLRFLANDPKASPKQRLDACKMLFALETKSDPEHLPGPPCVNDSIEVGHLLDKLYEDRSA